MRSASARLLPWPLLALLPGALAACGADARRPLGATCESSPQCDSGLCFEGHCMDPSAVEADVSDDATARPDTAVDDTAVDDTAVPDTTVPDTTVPDTTVPDTTVPDTTVDPGPEALHVFFADTFDFVTTLHATQSAGATYVVGTGAQGTLSLAFAGSAVGTYTCGTGATDVAWARVGAAPQHSNADGGSCTIVVTAYGAVGERIEGTFQGMIGDPMPGNGLPYAQGVFSVVRAADGDCDGPSWCPSACPADPAPPAECPAACTGGCAGGVCTIDCSGQKCSNGGPPPGATVTCPAGMACRIACTSGGCIASTLVCPDVGACDIACVGQFACQDASVVCGAGACFASSCGTADIGSASFLGWTCNGSCDCAKGCGP